MNLISLTPTQGGCGVSTLAAALAITAARREADVRDHPRPIVVRDVRPEDQLAIFGFSAADALDGVELAPGIYHNDTPMGVPDPAVVILADVDADLYTDDERDSELHLLVVRGPCYMGLRRAAAMPRRTEACVLLAEAGRALGVREVADVTGLPVIAQYDQRAVVARAVDAGVFSARPPESMTKIAQAILAHAGMVSA